MYNVQMLKHFSIYSNAFRIKYSQCYIFFVKCGGILLLFSLHFNQICAVKPHCVVFIVSLKLPGGFYLYSAAWVAVIYL